MQVVVTASTRTRITLTIEGKPHVCRKSAMEGWIPVADRFPEELTDLCIRWTTGQAKLPRVGDTVSL